MQLSWELKRKRLFPSQIKWNLKFANSLSPKCTVQFACYQEASFVLKATLRNYNPLQIFDTIRYTICILYSFYSVLLAKAPLVEVNAKRSSILLFHGYLLLIEGTFTSGENIVFPRLSFERFKINSKPMSQFIMSYFLWTPQQILQFL